MKCQEIQKQISKRLWDKEEDQLLLEVVARHKVTKWSQVAQEFNRLTIQLKGETSYEPTKRSNKQCRERWQNHLNPELRNDLPWLPEQRALLFRLFKECSHQWCRISEQLAQGGFAKRGDNNIKNYFYSAIKRAVRQINGYIQEHNRSIKKRKSELYNYHQKYAYKKRLSLQREIVEANEPVVRGEEGGVVAEGGEKQQLKIIRELDQEIINKILLIADLRGEKKFIVTKEEFQADACVLRNTIIDFLEDETTLDAQQAVVFARSLLEISRQCKRKAQRTSKHSLPCETATYLSESEMVKHQEQVSNDLKNRVETSPKQIQYMVQLQPTTDKLFNEKEVLQKLMVCEEDKPSKLPLLPSVNLPQDHSPAMMNVFPPNSEAMRFFLEQSSEFLYNSGQYSQYSQKYAAVPQYNFQHLTFGHGELKSLNFGQMIDSREVKNLEPLRMEREDACSNKAQFNFLNSIREIKPVHNIGESQVFDFDMGTPELSFIPHSLVRPEIQFEQPSGSEQERAHLFNSQPYLLRHESGSRSIKSRRSNNSRHTKKEGERESEGQELMASQHLLLRSWAYSQNRVEGRGCLFNSSEFEIKHEFPMDVKIGSNFQPFQ